MLQVASFLQVPVDIALTLKNIYNPHTFPTVLCERAYVRNYKITRLLDVHALLLINATLILQFITATPSGKETAREV